jgi:hypothetical protein
MHIILPYIIHLWFKAELYLNESPFLILLISKTGPSPKKELKNFNILKLYCNFHA